MGSKPVLAASTVFRFVLVIGLAWFAGSWLMAIPYGKSITTVIIFSVALQLFSLPIFLFAKKTRSASSHSF